MFVDSAVPGEDEERGGSKSGIGRFIIEAAQRTADMIRILIAADRQIVRQGLRRLLAEHRDLSVAAETGNYAETLSAVQAHDIDVAIVDLTMSGCDGVELSDLVKAIRPNVKILFLSAYSEKSIVLRALRARADGCMAKENTAEQMIALIRRLGGLEASAIRPWLRTRIS